MLESHIDANLLRMGDESIDQRALERRQQRIGEAPLERHQRRPVDRSVAGNAVTSHATVPRHDVRSADEHFLRIAAAVAAGAAEGLIIDDGHSPPRLTTAIRRRRSRGPGAEHDQVEFLFHVPLERVKRLYDASERNALYLP